MNWEEDGMSFSTPCRFHLGSDKTYINENMVVVEYAGTIRVNPGSKVPLPGQFVIIPGQFNGRIKQIYRGQLTWRIDV